MSVGSQVNFCYEKEKGQVVYVKNYVLNHASTLWALWGIATGDVWGRNHKKINNCQVSCD
jgi:hypothetical protein